MASDDIQGTTSPRGTAPTPGLGPSQPGPLHGDIGSGLIVVMGVSGTGKSTLGAALAAALRLPFIDGDDLHPPANVATMARGEPLADGDRWSWLETVRRAGVARVRDPVDPVEEHAEAGTDTGGVSGEGWHPGVVVACSALKKAYRAVLRGDPSPSSSSSSSSSLPQSTPSPTHFVYLKGEREVLMARMLQREGHFMKAGMLESQLGTLESPEDEPGVVTVPIEMSTEEQVRRVVDALQG